MTTQLLPFGLLLAGWALHALAKLYELDKATPGTVSLSTVLWGDERYRTIGTIAFMALVAFTGSADTALEAAGVEIAKASGMALIYISVGYNIDSLSKKILARAKPQE